jgi:DNA-binding transcriptional MerR regulator
MIQRLLDAGISIQQIRTVAKRLRSTPTQEWQSVTLMSDGASVYEATTREQVLELLESGRGVFGISLRGVINEVDVALNELRAYPLAEDQ